MEFATFEDQTALYDATLFPEVYRRCCHLLFPNRPYVLFGVVEEQFGVATLTVEDLQPLGRLREPPFLRSGRDRRGDEGR